MLNQLEFIKLPHAAPADFLKSAAFLEWCQSNDAIVHFETRSADVNPQELSSLTFLPEMMKALDKTVSHPTVSIITYERAHVIRDDDEKANMLEGLVIIVTEEENFAFGHFAIEGVVVGYRGEGSESRTSVYDTFAYHPSCRPLHGVISSGNI